MSAASTPSTPSFPGSYCGRSFLVTVYAGIDPLTGKRLYLNESVSTAKAAERVRTCLVSQVDEQRHACNRVPMTSPRLRLKTHEAESTTLDGYRGYIQRSIQPALGTVPIATITVRVADAFASSQTGWAAWSSSEVLPRRN
jgi:integrase